MSTVSTQNLALPIAQVLTSVLLAILFLQSSIDKVIDRRGNLEWLTGHFTKSALANFVGPMLSMLTLLEFTAGILSAVGAVLTLARHSTMIAFFGAAVAAVAIVALFFGQRMAKDYAGAAALVPYFILTLLAMFLLA